MYAGRITKNGEVLALPSLTAVVEKEGKWFVSRCPEVGVASQGKTRQEAYVMLAEAVELWLEHASAKEIKRRLKSGATPSRMSARSLKALSNPSSISAAWRNLCFESS
jgi:predicted RNase H-like HicB family nuclease